MSPPCSSLSSRENFRKRWGRLSAGMPLPSSETDTETWRSPGTALTRMVDDSGECLAALVSRLPSTWTMRDWSAITQGRLDGISTRRLCLFPLMWKLLLASPVRTARSVGSGTTGRFPVSMRATSRRSAMSARIRSVCSKMIRRNWRTSVGCIPENSSSRAETEPLTVAKGVRNSWLTMARNSARIRSISSISVMSWRVTIKFSTPSSSEGMDVAFISALMLRPSGACRTTSSARTVFPALKSWDIDNSSRKISCPSPRRIFTVLRNCSGWMSDSRRRSSIRTASRLNDNGAPVLPSRTATPTGHMPISDSRSILTRRTSRRLSASDTSGAAWDAANSMMASSS